MRPPHIQLSADPGGGRGIRTPGDITATVVFKTTAFVLSAIPPGQDLPAISPDSIYAYRSQCQMNRAQGSLLTLSLSGEPGPRIQPRLPAKAQYSPQSGRSFVLTFLSLPYLFFWGGQPQAASLVRGDTPRNAPRGSRPAPWLRPMRRLRPAPNHQKPTPLNASRLLAPRPPNDASRLRRPAAASRSRAPHTPSGLRLKAANPNRLTRTEP